MFSRFFVVLPIAALAAIATAAPNALEARGECNVKDIYCCNNEFTTPTLVTGILGGLLSGVVAHVHVPITCTPITVIGALSNGATCTTQTTCCENNQQNGLVNIECTPIAATA